MLHFRGVLLTKRTSMRSNFGQSALEMTILLAMAALALIAMSRYVQFGMGGRINSTGEGISQTLFDPDRTITTWNAIQNVRDRAYVNSYSQSDVGGNSITNRTDSF